MTNTCHAANRPQPDVNRLFATLPGDVRDRLAPHFKLINLAYGDVVYEAGEAERYAYFPNDSVISLLSVIGNGKSAEVATVGSEGIVGIAAFLGGKNASSRAIVQSAGTAFRLPGRLLKAELSRHSELLQLMLRYTQSLITEVSQSAVCIRHHTVEQQYCRRLLQALDRNAGNELLLTQDAIANLLGVRREGITEVAIRLRKLGVIEYRRGRIKVLDRGELELRTCECYGVITAASRSLVPARPRPGTMQQPDAAAFRWPVAGKAHVGHGALPG